MLKPGDIRYLVVHCSASPDDECIGAREIHEMHLGFGWHGCGYHRVICRDGTVEQGRPEYWVGAHVYGHNEESLGVCLIGCNSFTDAQMASLQQQLQEWQARYPAALIVGHCDFPETEKTCPNFNVADWCKQHKLQSGVVAPASPAPQTPQQPPEQHT